MKKKLKIFAAGNGHTKGSATLLALVLLPTGVFRLWTGSNGLMTIMDALMIAVGLLFALLAILLSRKSR